MHDDDGHCAALHASPLSERCCACVTMKIHNLGKKNCPHSAHSKVDLLVLSAANNFFPLYGGASTGPDILYFTYLLLCLISPNRLAPALPLLNCDAEEQKSQAAQSRVDTNSNNMLSLVRSLPPKHGGRYYYLSQPRHRFATNNIGNLLPPQCPNVHALFSARGNKRICD